MARLQKMVFPFLDLLVYRKANIPLPDNLVPIFVQVANLLEIPGATSLNFNLKLFFWLSTSKFLFGILVFFYVFSFPPCLEVLNYKVVIRCYRSLRLFYSYDISIIVKSVNNT